MAVACMCALASTWEHVAGQLRARGATVTRGSGWRGGWRGGCTWGSYEMVEHWLRLARNLQAVAGRLSAERTRMPRLTRNHRAVTGRLHAACLATAPPSTAELR